MWMLYVLKYISVYAQMRTYTQACTILCVSMYAYVHFTTFTTFKPHTQSDSNTVQTPAKCFHVTLYGRKHANMYFFAENDLSLSYMPTKMFF